MTALRRPSPMSHPSVPRSNHPRDLKEPCNIFVQGILFSGIKPNHNAFELADRIDRLLALGSIDWNCSDRASDWHV